MLDLRLYQAFQSRQAVSLFNSFQSISLPMPVNFKREKRLRTLKLFSSPQEVASKNLFISKILQILPILSLLLAVCGISFQVFVLYPWHEELSKTT